MKTEKLFYRLLGLILALSVLWAETGAVVAVSSELEAWAGAQTSQQQEESQALEGEEELSGETETPAASDDPAETASGEESRSPAGGGENGVEVVERPLQPVETPAPETTEPPKTEGTESPAPEGEESSAPKGPQAPVPEVVEPLPSEGSQSPMPTSTPEVDALPLPEIGTSLPEVVLGPLGVMKQLEAAAPFAAGNGEILYYRLGYGVKFDTTMNQDYREIIRLTELGGDYTVETTESADGVGENYSGSSILYGYRDYNAGSSMVEALTWAGSDGVEHSFCVFPSAEMLGRVPDQEFEGWYLYPQGTGPSGEPKTWSYGTDDELISLSKVLTSFQGAPMYDDTYERLYLDEEGAPNYDDEGNLIIMEHPYSDLGDTWDAMEYDIYAEAGYGSRNTVSIVGRWKASDRSEAAGKDGAALTVKGIPQELYGDDIAGKTPQECEGLKTDFKPEKQEYWLRVDADVTALDLTFNTYELYYNYHQAPEGKESPVTVTNTFSGQRVEYTQGLSQELLPKPVENGSYMGETLYIPGNSLEDPAHSQWTVTGISLTPSEGNGKLYNDIKVTVTSPSGLKQTVYTFHVQRLTEPTLSQAPGNTPIGMIRRDTSAIWWEQLPQGENPDGGDWETNTPAGIAAVTAANKRTAEENFKAKRKFDEDIYPRDNEHNQGGTIFRGTYSANAWLTALGKKDVDLDPTAIIVYQDAAFQDPGITVTDTEGNPVRLSGQSVRRTLTLRRQDRLSISGVGNGLGSSYEISGAVQDENGADQIDLRSQNILPGIYTMEYAYTDPISGKEYNFTGENFVTEDGKAGRTAFSRTVVVLPMPGDVDMDGAVTSADAVILKRNKGVAQGQPTLNGRNLTTDDAAALFAYRVCDADGSGSLNDADVDALEALPNPQLINAANVSESDYYYIPLPTGEDGSRYTRRRLNTGADNNKAVLSMEYMGKEKGTLTSQGYWTDPSGPWGGNNQEKVVLKDTFWLGVKLTNSSASALLNQSVHTFTFSLTYDAQYVEPVAVLDSAQWNGVVDQHPGATQQQLQQELWKGSMNHYNLGTGAANGRTVWGSQYTYQFTQAAGYDRPFTTHYSKAITPLEEEAGVATELRELVFSVEIANEGLTAATIQSEGSLWLFAVPFTLKKHPFGKTEAQLVELGAGMSDFTLVGPQTTVAANGVMALSDVVGRALSTPVAAYSAQEAIFGSYTGNLKTSLCYSSAGALIPLGEDLTEVNEIYNEWGVGTSSREEGVYSAQFEATGGWSSRSGKWVNFPLQSEATGNLPKGIQFDGSRIFGIPEEAGTFEFYVGSVPYRMVIKKAPLKFWAEDQYSYYGQTEFRGEQSKDFTFEYDPEDIRSIERERAEQNEGILLDGKGSGLRALLDEDESKYEPPAFTAKSGSGAVQNSTNVGTYAIDCPLIPKLKNYELEYTPQRKSRLTIMARPFLVTQIANGTNVGKVYTDQSGTINNISARLDPDGTKPLNQFLVELPHNEGEPEETYNGYPLTSMEEYTNGVLMPGDALSILYDASYVRTEQDLNGVGGFFTLGEGNRSEERAVQVGNIRLTSGSSNNYYLVNRLPVREVVYGEDGTPLVTGTVERRNVRSFNISQLPPLTYQYGERLTNSNELQFTILKDGDSREGTYAYNEETIGTELGVSVSWATAEERDIYLNHLKDYPEYTTESGKNWTWAGWQELTEEKGWEILPYASNQMFDMRYNGRYLCMSVRTADEAGNYITIRRYAEAGKTLTVTPRTITLTASSTRRFYGEKNTDLTFTYNPAQLANFDSAGRVLTGKGEELAEILSDENWEQENGGRGFRQGYTPPTLTAVNNAEEQVELKEDTVPGSRYAVMISGAKCESGNYVFQYANVYGDAAGTEPSKEFGASNFEILRRPIVVDAITKQGPLVTIYADTHQIYTMGMPLSKDEVKIGLPEHTTTTTSYYPVGGVAGISPNVTQAGFAEPEEGEEPVTILEGDDVSFTYTATVAPTDGADYVKYVSFSKGYFDMETNLNPDGSKDYPVQVSNLRLAGKDADKYALVFRTNPAANLSLPAQTTEIRNCIEPEYNSLRTYYPPSINGEMGMGKVILRPIQSIEIISPGKLDYIYGESYHPDQRGEDSQVMRINISYTKEGDNYDGNPTVGTVSMQISHYGENGQALTSFDDRSLVIYWLRGEDTPENRNKAIQNGQILSFQQALSVEEHDGVRLFITGKRGAQKEAIVSRATEEILTVTPRKLTLTAADQKRCYGEDNQPFSYTFDADQLAPQDQEVLADYTGALDGDALAFLARARGLSYVSPEITAPTAKKGSPVLSGGQGSYPILLSGGKLSNYTLEGRPGKLYIYPRLIKIASFESSGPQTGDPAGEIYKPIYTIYADSQAREFSTNVTNIPKEDQPSVNMTLPSGGVYLLPDGTNLSVTGDAVYGNDELTLRIRVQFDGLDGAEDVLQKENGKRWPVRVVSAELVSGVGNSSNYVLEKAGNTAAIMNEAAWGMIQLRSIQSIELKSRPQNLSYRYGDPLNLAGLEVTLRYNLIGGESDQSVDVPFLGTEQFAQYGLHVNYYDSKILPTDMEELAAIKTKYRTAATGDHLTIAPTHDTQGTGHPFSARGKYLVVTAQRHDAQETTALLVDCRGDGEPTPITISRLPLTFELSVEDKTYDGTTQAAGTLTLTNVYRMDNYVDAYNKAGVIDMVYPVIGADYEQTWDTLANGAASFNTYVGKNGYSFTTGTYIPAGPAPLGENYPLSWTGNSSAQALQENTLAFHFLDSNVAYAEATGHDSYGELASRQAKVTGIRLAGPDADNYTIVGVGPGQTGEVTEANVSTVEGYLGTALPEAVIHKANRPKLDDMAILPQVEVDEHTNVVRATFQRALNTVRGVAADPYGEAEEYRNELHYEYALQFNNSEEEQASLGQWAGSDGTLTWADGSRKQWDQAFFGGETVTLDMTGLEDYVPKDDDIPKAEDIKEDTVLKGQVYRWSEADEGFQLDAAAYPGDLGEPWPGYSLYQSERTALPRDAVFLPVVRVAETHNYHASPALSSVEGYTPQMIQDILKALNDVSSAATLGERDQALARLDAAAQAALAEIEGAFQSAKDAADERVEQMQQLGESGKWPEEWPEPESAPAVKTYRERIETISVKEMQSAAAAAGSEGYVVPTLEAVWFTDVLDYPKREVLDAVLHNNPTRYRGYAWDRDRSAELDFENKEKPFSLLEPFEVQIKRKVDNQEIEETILVNKDNNAQIYVDISHPSGGSTLTRVEQITIDSEDITAVLGDDPVKLTATLHPPEATNRAIRWKSSDPSVATVSSDGTVTFVGIGTAVITATSVDGATDSITVTVVEALPPSQYPNSIFNFALEDAFVILDKDMRFGPEVEMTRGEAAILLARFYVENSNWKKTGPKDFPDLTGKEPYAEAARLLSSLGVMTGLPDGSFSGEKGITRAEFVVMLVRMMGIEVPNTKGQKHAFLDTYEDVTGVDGTWAYSEIDALSKIEGVLQGVGQGYFAPRRNITRAEAASFLRRLLQFPNVADRKDLLIPVDVSGEHWARDSILRAVNRGAKSEEDPKETEKNR